MINIYCAKARAALTSPPELLTAGMAKTVTVRLDFSCDWDGLTKTAVFTDGWRTVDVLESAWENSCVDIPHEVLQTAGRNVRVGVYGCDSNGTALPTIWAELGRVRHGADPAGDESTEPAVPMWGQIQDQIGSLADLSTAAKDNLVAAINEAAKTGSGSDPSAPTTPVDAVLYTEQTLTEKQQEQARANINASSNYARECSHLWFVRDNGEHYRDIVTAARSGGNPVVIRESDWSGTTFIAPAIAVIGDYVSQNSSVPYPITIFSADGTMWFTEIYNLYGEYLTTPRMTELRRIDTAETDVLHVTLTTDDDNVDTSDTTAAAVQEALAAGKVVTVTIGDRADVALLLSAVEGATTGSYDMQLVSAWGVILYTANGTQWTRTSASFGGLATLDDVYAGAVSLGGMSGAAAGQIAKITAVDTDGKPTAWEPVDMAGEEKWEKIAEIVIPEGADEATALTINKDSDGNPFSLVKARLCAKFPKYTGATTIPNFSFAMLNGKTAGRVTPLAYTSVWPKASASLITGTVYEIDVSGAQQIEHVIRSANGGWSDDSSRDYVVYGTTSDTDTTWFGDTLWAKPITSIGGTGMLIYPGCRFVLYGVRA